MPDETILKSDFGHAPEEAYFTFRPRPDDPARFDEQTSAYYSTPSGIVFILGGNGSGTSEIALAKVAKFVLSEQAPPRKDTPFWIISNTFKIVCDVAWKEKLFGHGHIPVAEVDWDRVQWYKEIRGWPLAVPLKPWVDQPGRNWVLEFKSYKEGRQMMQASSIGGFCFIEQFPWPLLTEVLRGCREYSFRGNKICEFTPIEPGLTEELEDMIERDALPEDWEVYRMNTQCALEAGHVSQEWFNTFFAMVPESMRPTRMTGEMPTYEGAIYSTFNPKIHCIDIARKIPTMVQHRRAIDWGSGPDNAFVCLWFFINSIGQIFVYDEYYSNDLSRSVIDHLCQIQDQFPWPDGNPAYGTTWADPSAVGYLRIASRLSEYAPRGPSGKCRYKDMNISGANNSVLPGIEHVQYLLKPLPGLPAPFDTKQLPGGHPQLFIDRTNCRNLRREMRTYRWQKKNPNALAPKDARPEPLKVDDHCVDALRYGAFSEAKYTIGDIASVHRPEQGERFGVQLTRQASSRHGIHFQGRRR
jgi:hypothetical protein